ncbi:MAP7 domain-containing protein 3 isoform X3 [Sus scrofa]|uniref:MAP7 domain-containing protein 3 isoform X3 n=1 Tax=Sus scrofa TaxID=9823 RepID=UPI0003AE8240|nr:MAP7 domain-containing protein 3 isoform X3 [Sus scrofa]
MAERTRTSLKGLRERMVAAANAIAEERRNQRGFSTLPSQSSNMKSSFKPVLGGSVLKNDIKQRLEKERREEKKRQDANKETQLLEKERKSKILYEKQTEEKQRKLREQKERDEQRRISVEKRRKDRLQEERKFKAVFYRTLERSSNRVDFQKRWSWEGWTAVSSSTINSEDKTETAKKRRSSSLNRRCSKPHSSTEIEQVEEKTTDIHSVVQYVRMPLLSNSSHELKSTIVPCKSTVAMPPHEKVETPSKTSVEAPPKASVEVPPEVSVEVSPKVSLEALPGTSYEALPETSYESYEALPGTSYESYEALPGTSYESYEALPGTSYEALPGTSYGVLPGMSYGVLPGMNFEAYPESVETSPEANVDLSSDVSMDSSPEVSVDPSPKVSTDSSEVSAEVSSEASVETSPEASMETLPEENESLEALPEENEDLEDLEALPEENEDLEALPEENEGLEELEALPEENESLEALSEENEDLEDLEALPEENESLEALSEENEDLEGLEALSEENEDLEDLQALSEENESLEALPEASVKMLPEESMEVPSEANVKGLPEASLEVTRKTSSKAKVKDSLQKSETDIQASKPIPKTRLPPSQIPCYRWSSSPTSRWRPPSPVSASRQIQKNRLLSPSPVTSKPAAQFSFSYKVIPIQRTPLAQNAGTIGMKSEAISNTSKSSEAASQKDMICEESGNKSTPGPMNAKEGTKILAEKRRVAREQKEKEEERPQKEMEQRKIKDMTKKVDEGQEEAFSKFEDGQQPKEFEKKKGSQNQDQNVQLQRIEETMKRTRKPDSNAIQAAEASSNDAHEDDEADDEDEPESDIDSFDDLYPSAFINGIDSSTKLKTHFKNVKNAHKLVFLDATSSHSYKDATTFFNCDTKTFRQKQVKDPLNRTKSSRSSTKGTTSRAAKTGEAVISNTVGPAKSLHSEAQEWICDKIIDITSRTEPPRSRSLPKSQKHHLKGSTTSCLSHQPPIDNTESSTSVPAPSAR